MLRPIINRMKSHFSRRYLAEMGFSSGKGFTEQWLEKAVPGCLVLDAGCGEGNIREILPPGIHYVGVDMLHGDDASGYEGWKHKPTVLADLHDLPISDSSCDVILFFQVLEHVRSPEKVLLELKRVMKPAALMAVSSPLIHPIHHAPNDFFRFTRYGIEHLFESCGLEICSIRPSGGYFRALGNCLGYFSTLYISKNLATKIILLPLFLWILMLKKAINILEYPLDLFDNHQEFVSGYHCIIRKRDMI